MSILFSLSLSLNKMWRPCVARGQPWLMLAIFSIIVVQIVAAEKDQRPPIARMKAAEIEDALHVSLSKPKGAPIRFSY